MASQDVELEARFSPTQNDTSEQNPRINVVDALPPTDRGRGAYTALACCTVAQAPIWGYSVSFGIFQEHYASPSSGLDASPSAIASIGTSQTGIMYLLMPLTFILLRRCPRARPYCAPLGLLITAASLVASAFVRSAAGLLATQGVLYALGCVLLFTPVSLAMDEWFVERKGLAYGVMWAGKSSVGVAMPLAFGALLSRFGTRATLLAWAAASVVLTLPVIVFLRPRVDPRSGSGSGPLGFSFLRSPSFWILQAGIAIQALGYLMPTTYLASYAASLGLPSLTGPLLLALLNLASVPGSLVHGLLGDHLSASKLLLVSSLGSAIPVFLLWGLDRHLATLVVFVVLYGFFAGGFSATWSGVLQLVRTEDDAVDTSLVFGMLLGGRGVGYIVAGPVSGALVSAGGSVSSDEALGYATRYGPMILCTGFTAILGASAPLWRCIEAAGSRCTDYCIRRAASRAA